MSTTTAPSSPQETPVATPSNDRKGAFSLAALVEAVPGAVRKLDPRSMWRNPVMFIVEVGAVLTTLIAIAEPFVGGPESSGGSEIPLTFTWGIAVWLWLTVIFANLAESVAEGRGKAQADSLRQTRTSTTAHQVTDYDATADPSAEERSAT
jgi:K+-transporting ATPase ATPase B chain